LLPLAGEVTIVVDDTDRTVVIISSLILQTITVQRMSTAVDRVASKVLNQKSFKYSNNVKINFSRTYSEASAISWNMKQLHVYQRQLLQNLNGWVVTNGTVRSSG